MRADPDLFQRLEDYYDSVPRRFASVEELGPFTLFLGEPGGWVYYARPRLGGSGPFDASDVTAACSRLRELGLPEVVEWVHETTPGLLEAVRAEGSLTVEEIPLLSLPASAAATAPPLPDDVTVRHLTPSDDETLAGALAVASVGFASPGTEVGGDGALERDRARRPAPQRVLDLLADGSVHVAVAETSSHGALATGRAIPLDGVAEIVGVATLPAARRQGLGAAVTAALVEELRRQGVSTIFLTASSDAVARVYEAVGFERIGSGYAAERV